MHLLSPRAQRGPPGRRYARGRAGRAFVYRDCSANRVQRKWQRGKLEVKVTYLTYSLGQH